MTDERQLLLLLAKAVSAMLEAQATENSTRQAREITDLVKKMGYGWGPTRKEPK